MRFDLPLRYGTMASMPEAERDRGAVAEQADDKNRSFSAKRRAALGVRDLDIVQPRFPPPRINRVLRKAGGAVRDFVFDRELETAGGYVALEHFHSERVIYEPSGWFYLRRALRRGDVRPGDVFVDFGSGKGRIVYQAARYPFARVMGIEISEHLNHVARQNIERNRRRLVCQDVELVTMDAVEFPVPDDVTHAYFYYPFEGETFRRVLDNIVESLDRRPRRLRLIYACPGQETRIRETGRFELVRRSRGGLTSYLPRTISVYESSESPAAQSRSS
jgi:hypothetical protein